MNAPSGIHEATSILITHGISRRTIFLPIKIS